mmetsp:Transcript_128973/g.413084  ORF Transcript_128973/g.413084 Transcript_128973/m.413084 type:complete len:192 (-) Transcript_128973:309-884(-)
MARVAKYSDVTLLSNWVNDFTARFPGNTCFDGESLSMDDVSVSVESLRILIRAIHAENPKVMVVVMAKYPGAAGRRIGADYSNLNMAVRAALADEPSTVFANFEFPLDEDMFLMSKSGHPNCRGDRVMASAVIEALFNARVLSRGLALGEPGACLADTACSELSASLACCQRAALCRVAEGQCVPYSTGEQ